MDSAQKTLIDIASVSQRVVNALIWYTGRKTVESFRLDRVIVGSGSILEILNKALLLKGSHVDDRLVDWLHSEEPRVCLDTLKRMEAILANRKLEYGVKNFFNMASHSPHTQNECNEAIKLFQMHQGYFHFLITTDIWNCESNGATHERPQTLASSWHHTEEDSQTLTEPTRRKSEYTSTVPQGNLTNQGVYMEKLKNILGWLNPFDCKEIHRRTIELREKGTCTWLPDKTEYKTWRSTKDSFLWLHGKAGAGKSVLAASVIENVESTLNDGEILVFFYCDFRNERSTNAGEVMRSLLFQLLQHFRHHTVGFKDLVDDLVKEREGGPLVLSDTVLLARYVSRIAQRVGQQPFFVIDALDECRDTEELLDAVSELMNGGIRLFVTSRPLQVIKDNLSDLPSISMDTTKFEIRDDITLHIARVLDSHRRLRIMEASLKDEIFWALCYKADGMFRWVHCQLNMLKRCMTAVQIRRALDNLPNDLDVTYARILLRISENEREVVRRALYWLVAALQPLRLCQILDGLSIDLGRRYMDRDSGPVHGPALLDALDSLVMYDEVTDLITLSHASVKEYLIAESTCLKHPLYHINEQDAHIQLALLCMCYITISLEQSQRSGGYGMSPPKTYKSRPRHDNLDTASFLVQRRKPLLSLYEICPLLAYVQSCGFQHLEHVDPTDGGVQVLGAIEALQSDVRLYSSEWKWLCEKSEFVTKWPAPNLRDDLVLYTLIVFAPAPLLRLYIGSTQLKPKDGMNPLIYAALYHKIEHAKILLSKGVCLDRKGWNPSSNRRVLPLEAAARVRDYPSATMVNLFLTEGSPVPDGLFEGAVRENIRFPICVVQQLLQTDEFVEWASAIGDQRRLMCILDPTHYLDGPGGPPEEVMESMERRLVQIGCNTSTWFDETSLRRAVRVGHISTVKRMLSQNILLPPDIILDASNLEMIDFLLSFGSDIRVTSSEENTLLHLLIKKDSNHDNDDEDLLEMVETLIRAGCDLDARNLAGETILHVAVTAECVFIVEYLLSLGVPLPSDILLATCYPSMIRFLLNEGADVHAIAANGNTVLHVALEQNCNDWDQCLEITKILIGSGCDPCSPNAQGGTPFDVAVKHGHLAVVQYLLSLNIPLPSGILFSAVRSHNPTSMIKFLLEKGADVHITSPNGDNLLCVLMKDRGIWLEEDCLERVKILIGAGCDAHVCNATGETLFRFVVERKYFAVLEYLLSLDIPAPSDISLAHFGKGGRLEGSIETIRSFLDNGGSIHAVAENGDTLLHLAVQVSPEEDALDLTKRLVHSGCSPCASNLAQETPFHIASQCAHISVITYFLSLGLPLPPDILFSTPMWEGTKMIRYLIQNGADVSATTTDKDTPLHQVTAFGHEHDRLECVKILIDAGCDPRSENLSGKTPMHLAAQQGYISIVEFLLSQGISPPRDILAFSTARIIRFLLRNGNDVHSLIDGDVMFPLHYEPYYSRSEEDCLERVRILVDAGRDPSEYFLGETPIHIAATYKYISVIKYLLSRNAALPSDILLAATQTDFIWEDRALLFRFLIREGANPNASNWDGDTPLHRIFRCDITKGGGNSWDEKDVYTSVEVLLNAGANPFIKNAYGKAPVDLAEEKGNFFKDNFLRLVRNAIEHRLHSNEPTADHSSGSTTDVSDHEGGTEKSEAVANQDG